MNNYPHIYLFGTEAVTRRCAYCPTYHLYCVYCNDYGWWHMFVTPTQYYFGVRV